MNVPRKTIWHRHLTVPLCLLAACNGDGASPGIASESAAQITEPVSISASKRDLVPRVASYRLKARLDEKTHTVKAEGTIEWQNPSAEPTSELYFHLYLNAFSDAETLFQRGRASRSGHRRGRPGKIEIHSLTSERFGEKELWPGPSAHTPGDPKDRTDIRVALPEPISGNETISFQVEFTSTLPEIVERTGYEGDFHFVAQWFPKLAKREQNGTWAHFPFHPNGEFYADFGEYDIELNVPEDAVIGATGSLRIRPSSEKDRSVYQATAKGVHDFAFTAWPDFVVEERTVADVHVRLLRPPYMPLSARETWSTVEAGLTHLGKAYGKYPFDHLTIVHPPAFAQRAGGMEYPQLITTGGSEWSVLLGVRQIERVTIHELAHQWFQGLLASNEMGTPFLDEGLTSYAEARYLDEAESGASLLSAAGLDVSRLAGARLYHFLLPTSEPITQPAPKFKSFQSIGSLVYARSTLCLETLARVYSREKLYAALGDYARRYSFAHPTLDNFYDVLQEHLGKAARTQAQLMLDDNGSLDLSVGKISINKDTEGFVTEIEIEKSGDLDLPFEVLLKFADGKVQRHSLRSSEKDLSLSVRHRSELSLVHVDPQNKIAVDSNLLDNQRRLTRLPPFGQAKQRQAAVSLASWLLAWVSP